MMVGRTISYCISRSLRPFFSPVSFVNDSFLLSHLVTSVSLFRSKHMVALAEALRQAELHKKDLDLELEILEEAAEMVVKEEQEEQIKKQEGREDQMKESEEEDESSSSSEEDDDHDSSAAESEEEEQKGVTDGPAITCPCSQDLEHGESLIQELGDRLQEEEPRIREDVPQITIPSSSTAREKEGVVDRLRKIDDSQLLVALDGVKITDAASGTAQLEHRQRNVRILNAEELDSDDEDEAN